VLAIAAGLFPVWKAGWWAAIGYRNHQAGAHRKALEAYAASLELDPSQTWVRANLVQLLARAGQFRQARAALDELWRQDPETATRVVEKLEQTGAAEWAH